MRILIAEDDAALAGFIRQGLQGEHYTVDMVEDGEQARAMGTEFDYDLVILDLNLPKLDGVSVLRHLRLKRPSLPMLVLTQRSRVEDRVQCLDTGADDYLPKPFSFNELSARIRALLRRSHLPSGSVLVVEDLKLDRVEHRAERAGRRIELTSKEFSLLEYLMRNAGRQVSRAMIIEHVWNVAFDTTTNVVDVYINTPIRFLHDAWHDAWRRAAPACRGCDSMRLRSRWQRMHHRSSGVLLHGHRYCGSDCLRQALAEILGQTRAAPRRAATTSHRVPLGLLLLSRQQLSAEQLRAALEMQRNTGQRKIGEWLQQLGFASEIEVTAALARQWGCPLLRGDAANLLADHCPAIPLPLLESFQMMPVELAESSRTLLVAFSGGVDHTALYAIERMLGYHTQPCLVTASTMRQGLLALAGIRVADDLVFDRVDDSECAHIIGSYAAKLAAQEIRLARCVKHLWVRFERAEGRALNIVMTAPERQTPRSANDSVRDPE